MQVQNAIFGGVQSVQYELCRYFKGMDVKDCFYPWAAAALDLEWLGR